MRIKSIAQDVLPSIVVFVVALPLCMGIAIASGAPVERGLVSGIVGGLVVGFISGSPLQVSGPAAGLAVIVWDMIQRFGLSTLGVIVLLAGAIQLVAGLLRGGRWFRAVPPSVIHGMLAGIGALILASQFHVMLDDDPKDSGLANVATIPAALWKAVSPQTGVSHHIAAGIGVLTIATIVLWPRVARGRLRVLPAPLVGVAVATLVAGLLGLDIAYVDVGANLVDALELPSLETLRRVFTPAILFAGAAVAVIASAESLLCATAVDRMQHGPRTNYDRELAAQGVGNILCGLVGALPMTGVIVRSSANVEAGAKTRASTIMHGLWLLVLVTTASSVLERIPVSSLAAILVFIGYKLLDQKIGGERVVPALARFGRGEAAIYLVTVVAIVTTDLLVGVGIGLALAMVRLLWQLNRLEIVVKGDASRRRTDIHLRGTATFVRLPDLAAAFESVPSDHELHVHIDALDRIDHACLDALTSWEKLHSSRGGSVSIDWRELQFRSVANDTAKGAPAREANDGGSARRETPAPGR